MTPRLFRAWQVALGLTLGTIKNYRNSHPIPPAVACRAMLNDRHIIAAHYRPRKAGRPGAAAQVRSGGLLSLSEISA
ncbi:MAG: hypothetical protein HOP13_01595 [Alphaproteobacteria bacterium]|nr:hypothetical protein [Alphaproteobacteria bacterium]